MVSSYESLCGCSMIYPGVPFDLSRPSDFRGKLQPNGQLCGTGLDKAAREATKLKNCRGLK